MPLIAIHGTVAELQQLSNQNTCGAGRDNILIHLKQKVTLKLVIGFFGFGIQHHRDFMLDKVR